MVTNKRGQKIVLRNRTEIPFVIHVAEEPAEKLADRNLAELSSAYDSGCADQFNGFVAESRELKEASQPGDARHLNGEGFGKG